MDDRKHTKPMILSTNKKDARTGGDCDCACAATLCADLALADLTGPWRSASVETFPLPNGWRGLHNPAGSAPLVVINQPVYDLWSSITNHATIDAAHFSAQEQAVLTEMLRAGLLRPEAKSVAPITNARPQNPDHPISAWLHLTDRCNLRCAYCYLPHVREDMTPETGRAAVEAIFRSARAHGYQKVKLKYAGGEPLLRFPLIVELQQYAQKLAQENNIEMDAVVLSNGTLLTEAMIAKMQILGLRLMISLDGLGDWHDAQRPYAGGRGTFNDVAESVDLALAHDLVPHLSITVSGHSAEGLPEIIAWVLARDLPFSINFYRENDLSLSHDTLKLEEDKIINGMMAAFKVIEEDLPSHSLLAALADRANLSAPHLKTCSVGQDYLVFDQHGRVAKCQMKMHETVSDMHAEDPLQLIRADKGGVQNLSVEEKAGCRDCQWKYQCTGGCPLMAYRATGRYDVKSPNCHIYKAIFPEILRLEGLRLLKEAGELA